MCGILGSIGVFPRSLFEKGLYRLAHRGPDGSGVWNQANIMLGHRRLAILELTDLGKQPMEDGELNIIFNGEIYNYKEVRRVLEGHGHVFQSNSDTEVILKAFRQWGHRCLEKFNGMWSFAIWDSAKRKLFISRDRFGVKPLFYAFTNNGFVFGSEMKALAPLLDQVSISKDFHWCEENIYAYETSEKSLIEGIKRFPAAHFAYVTEGDVIVKPERYWNTLDNIVPVEESYTNQVLHFRELFFDAIKIRMRSDVKIGTALSGGLDSSAVAAAMHYLGANKKDLNDFGIQENSQNAFVATFTGTDLDETEYAKDVVNSLNLNGHFYEIDAIKGIDNLDEYLWLVEELSLTSPIPMIEIYKRVKANGVSVSLDGHGADELFSGYGTLIFNAVKDSPFKLRKIRAIANIYKEMRNIKKSSFSVVVDGFAGRKNMLKFYINTLLNLEEKDPLVKRLGFFNAALYKEFHFNILPTLLRNYDRYSMAASVEVRMPFLDYRLVSYCFSLPWESKIADGYTKSILRDAIEAFLPKKIVRRKVKTGFGTPFTHWLKGPWKEFIFDNMNSLPFKNSSVMDSKKATSAINTFYAKPNPAFEDGEEVWRVMIPYLWEKSFYNKVKN